MSSNWALFRSDLSRTRMINRRRRNINTTSFARRYTDSHEIGTTSQGAHVFTPSYAPTVLGVPIDIASSDEPDRFAGGAGGQFGAGGASGSSSSSDS